MKLVSARSIVYELFVTVRYIKSIQNQHQKQQTYRPDSFLTIFRREIITPYTSFASSSKGNALIEGLDIVGVCCGEFIGGLSFVATVTPELDIRVFLGLLNVDELPGLSALGGGDG